MYAIRLFLISFFLYLFITSQAFACYTAKDAEAEQGLRIQNELMIISLTCNSISTEGDLYSKYKEFSAKNGNLLLAYEADFIKYYSKTGTDDPTKALHVFEEQIANKISKRAIDMSLMDFCERFAGRVDAALEMSDSDFRSWASYVWSEGDLSQPLCR